MVKGHGIEEDEYLERDEHADELILMGLRLAEGFDPQRFEKISGFRLPQDKIEFLEKIGMVEKLPSGKIRATLKGFMVLDAVVADIASQASDFN